MATILVELCAGLGSVSLVWMDPRARTLVGYQGGKQRHAKQILQVLGLEPGTGTAAQIVLVEPGPAGELWSVLSTPRGRAAVLAWLRSWQREDPFVLWTRLLDAPVPRSAAQRVASWLVLQFWSYAGHPIILKSGRFHGQGFKRCDAYRTACHDSAVRPWKAGVRGRDQRLPQLIEKIENLPPLSGLEVLHCRAEQLQPFAGATVLIDPPYQDASTDFGWDLPRAEALALGRRWKAAGAVRVAICERVALTRRAIVLERPTGGRTLQAGHPEVVSLL